MAAQSKLRDHRHDPLVMLFRHYASLVSTRIKRASRTAKLLSTLLVTISIISSGYGIQRWWKSDKAEKATGRRLLRRNSGLRGKDGSRTIYVPYKDTTSKVVIHPTKLTTFDAHRRLFLQPPRAAGLGDGSQPQVPPPQTKPGLNLAFLHQFLSLLNIMIPRWTSKEAGLLLSHSIFLVLRTYLSLVVARLDGEIVRDLVGGNGKAFLWGILKWCGIGSVASYTNAMIKFLQSKVSIAFRTRLTRYIHDLYLNDKLNYYRLLNLDGGVGTQADQFITQDLTLFCASAASLYSSLGKPFVDICVFNYQLYRSLGPLAFSGLLINYFGTATLLRKLSPPFGKLKAVEGRREGDFRALHARLIANAEEVAFYGGDEMERTFLDKGFRDLKHWMEGIYSLKIRYNMLEDFVVKYSWSAFGYLITSLPVFLPLWGGLGGESELGDIGNATGRERDRMKDFITNKRLMLSLADAGGRMMYSIKDLSELAGYTSRVYTLISTLHRVHADAYLPPPGTRPELFSLCDVQGTVHKGFDGVRLENVPVVAPTLFPMGGDELIDQLSVIVHSGEHLLVTGPNGCGKSAVARIVAGLWPVYRGLMSRPRTIGQDGIMFLPQRPYLSTGTLRDQVIYPHTEVDMKAAGRRDFELSQILEEARLGYIPDREGGYDTRKDWKDILSGGEKQRMGIARLLYHEPRYAFIDEGTSAVSSDVEGLLYENAKAKGISAYLSIRSVNKLLTNRHFSPDHDFNSCISQAISHAHTNAWPW
jgi:ATP-binding cassette subfamily D (ALD) long-chain fatty acid import protein